MTRRRILNLAGCAASGCLLAELPDLLPLPGRKGRLIRTEIRGKRVVLEELVPSRNTVYAQSYYAFQYRTPYAYFGNYQMWASWNAMQYQAYMQRLIQQYTWAQYYQNALAQYMQQYANNSYSLSQPFALDSIRSIYSYGRGSDEVLLGLNKYQNNVQASGPSVRAVSAVADIIEDEGYSRTRIERSAGPQSSAVRTTEYLGEAPVGGAGFRTDNGKVFASARRFRDTDSGDQGNLLMFDDGARKQRHFVELA